MLLLTSITGIKDSKVLFKDEVMQSHLVVPKECLSPSDN